MFCAYCLDSRELREDQVLRRGETFYLCAPRGQLVEGYLAIAPYRCIGCLSHLPAECFSELRRLVDAVTAFYADIFRIARPMLYEQGRAGGGASTDQEGGFPLHAHLCCLPLTIDLHSVLAREYEQKALAGPHELFAVVGSEPYLYVEIGDERFAYVARSTGARNELARKRLKPTIATLAGFPERGYWRAYPGDRELESLIHRWRAYDRTRQYQ